MSILLNPEQEDAVKHEYGPCMVLAGPGTGKTRILVERVRRLLDAGYPPESLYLMTFTNKATSEMSSRLQEINEGFKNVSTLHALAKRTIMASYRLDNKPSPEILDEKACFDLFSRVYASLYDSGSQMNAKELWVEMNTWRNKSPKRSPDDCRFAVYDVYNRYQGALKGENKLDLSDLIFMASKVLDEDSRVLAAYSALDFILVDEFQDTSLAEYNFIRKIMGEKQNLMCVAAAAQSIYSWRGADFPRLKSRFLDDFPFAKWVCLKQNYRSGKEIVLAAASMVPDEPEVHLDASGKGYVYVNRLPDNVAEAHFVARTIKDVMKLEGTEWRHFAVLVREWSQAVPLEMAFAENNIPYQLAGADRFRFYDKPAIKAMMGYLAAIESLRTDKSSLAEGSLEAMLNVPPRGIGTRSMIALRGQEMFITWESVIKAMVSPDIRDQVKSSLGELFAMLSKLASQNLPPYDLIDAVIRETRWLDLSESSLEGPAMVRDLRTLQEEAARYRSVQEMMNAMNNINKFAFDTDFGVTISSIHASKGLEWPYVFIPGMIEGILPSNQSVKENDVDGEARVAHVALSRAKKAMWLTTVMSWIDLKKGTERAVKPSPFLGRLPREIICEYTGNSQLLADTVLLEGTDTRQWETDAVTAGWSIDRFFD